MFLGWGSCLGWEFLSVVWVCGVSVWSWNYACGFPSLIFPELAILGDVETSEAFGVFPAKQRNKFDLITDTCPAVSQFLRRVHSVISWVLFCQFFCTS